MVQVLYLRADGGRSSLPPAAPRMENPVPTKAASGMRLAGRLRWVLPNIILDTVCPRSSDQFYIVSYYIKLVATSWTNGFSGDFAPTFICFGSEHGLKMNSI